MWSVLLKICNVICDSVLSGDDKFTTAEADQARRDHVNKNQQVMHSPQEQERRRKKNGIIPVQCRGPGTSDEMKTCEQIGLVYFSCCSRQVMHGLPGSVQKAMSRHTPHCADIPGGPSAPRRPLARRTSFWVRTMALRFAWQARKMTHGAFLGRRPPRKLFVLPCRCKQELLPGKSQPCASVIAWVG